MTTQEPARIEVHRLAASAGFPNNPVLPLLVYRQAIPGERPDPAREVERRLAAHGWRGAWRNGVYAYHHFHSNAHELLAVCAGQAEIQFGGPSGPIVAIAAGDVAVLPAGTGHKRVRASSDFLVVGAYPGGQEDYDLCRGEPDKQSAAMERIARVPLPEADPLFGPDGPLFEHWTRPPG